MPRVLKPKPTKEEILAIDGSVPVEMAARIQPPIHLYKILYFCPCGSGDTFFSSPFI